MAMPQYQLSGKLEILLIRKTIKSTPVLTFIPFQNYFIETLNPGTYDQECIHSQQCEIIWQRRAAYAVCTRLWL
jgi:hypothetical protein